MNQKNLQLISAQCRRLAVLCCASAVWLAAGPAQAQAPATGNDAIVAAREALKKRDGARLAALRTTALAERHPLAMWVDYWELSNRLFASTTDEVEAFYKRWPGSYVEDRLRNDWLLELGRRRDWKALAADYPRFRMNDDREVSCYAALADHLDGKDNRATARAAWLAQRDADDGCALLGTTLYDTKWLSEADAWKRARQALDAGKPKLARLAAALVSPRASNDAAELADNPTRYLKTAATRTRQDKELATLALIRLAASDPDAAVTALQTQWDAALPADLSAWAWGAVAKQAAIKLMPDAADLYQRADLAAAKAGGEVEWPDELLAWKARAALRANDGKPRWQQLVQAVNAMSPSEQRDATWVYWKARALQALARSSSDPEAMAAQSREMLTGLAGQLSFYGALAAETLEQPLLLPAPPSPPSDTERNAALREPGLQRALQLIGLGLRNEGVREWNFTLRGMDDRALLAAAQLACDREVWDRCINTSERTKTEVNLAQRYPMPFRKEVQARAQEMGLDPAYIYGLIRQESRFVMDARSGVGASGLMQIMPATARWTARKMGLTYSHDMITDRDTNLRLGTQYLRLVLDDFDSSALLAAAAYNAGPNRPRRWREGPVLDAAAWAENVPFTETRDYVKKVLTNAAVYRALMASPAPAQLPPLRQYLGRTVGPREGPPPALDKELP